MIKNQKKYLIFKTKKKIYFLKVNGASIALPYSDTNVSIADSAGTITIDATQFFISFGNAFLKLVSCAPANFGVCASTESDPSSALAKYLPNDQYWIDGTVVSCPTGWTALNGRCYQRFGGVLAYDASQADCQSKNASLAILNTQAKFDSAKTLVNGGEIMVRLSFLKRICLLQTYSLIMTDRLVFSSISKCFNLFLFI